MECEPDAGRVSKAIESILLVEDHLSQLERHSVKQVRLLQEEQVVLDDSSEYQPLSNASGADAATLAMYGSRLQHVQHEVKGIQKDMYALQKDHDQFVKETYEMFSETSLLVCEAVENCFGRRRLGK